MLPDTPMGAGTYIASVTSKDERGGKITVQRNFTIAKSGEQVLGVATGEPTLVPTVVVTPTLSPTTTLTSTPQVTPSSSPSLSTTPTPTTVMTYPTVQPSPQTPSLRWEFLYAYFCKLFLLLLWVLVSCLFFKINLFNMNIWAE